MDYHNYTIIDIHDFNVTSSFGGGFLKQIDNLMEWFRDKENLANLRTATTIVFILIFVIYFYGFRTGFEIDINDIGDIIIDVVIILTTALMVINDFAMRGIQAELGEDNQELDNLVKTHRTETQEIDDDKVHAQLVHYNAKKDKEALESKKREYVKRYKQKRRKHQKGSRKYYKLTIKIEHYQDKDTYVKFKRKHVTVEDLKKRGAMRDKKKVIGVDYSPKRHTVSSQSGMVFVIVIFTALMRFGVDPSWNALAEALLFLGFLIPFLLIRAIISYQMARYNTKENYPLAIQEQIDILKWCKTKGAEIEKKIEPQIDKG